MTNLDSIVTLQITKESSALTLPGFGTPLILPATIPASITERLRYYTNPADMLDDGFTSSDMAYIQARALMSQRPHPDRFAIGRRASAVAQFQLFVVPAAPDNTTLYRIVINGTNCDFTTDASATQTELRDGLIAAVNAAVGAAVTATASGNDVLITADVAGIPFTYSIATGPATPLTLPTQTQLFVTPAAPNNSTLYRIVINGTPCDFTTDGAATQAELRDGMIAAINAAVGSAVTATASGTDILVTADTAGTNFTFAIVDLPTTNRITAGAATGARPNVGIPEDLAAIIDEQPDWYCLLITQRDTPHILVAAAEIEAMRRIFVAQSGEAAILSAPYNSGDTDHDVASELHALGYERTALFYSSDGDAALDAVAVGRCLPPIPGSITWKFKQLSGVTAEDLSTTELTNLTSKSGNTYIEVAGRSIIVEGTVASGEFIDITHGTDKLYSRIQELVMQALLKAAKVPFTQVGLNSLLSPITAALNESVSDGLIAESRTLPDGEIESPGFTVTAPKIENIPSGDRQLRRIPASQPFKFEATFAGAVHRVRIEGTLSF